MNDYRTQIKIETEGLRNSGLTEAQLSGISEGLGKVVDIMGGFASDVEHAQNSGKYTPTGLQDFKHQRAKQAVTELKAHLDPKFKAFDDQIAQARATMQRKPPTSEDAQVRYWREREIRDRLTGKDVLQRELLYQGAAGEAGNDAFLDACENAPCIPGEQPFIRANVLEEGRQARLRLQNPEAAARSDQLGAMRKIYSGYLAQVTRELEAEVGPLGPDAIAEAAAGKA
jgi:hypothetical protein